MSNQHRKTLVLDCVVSFDRNSGHLVIVPDEPSMELLKAAADVRCSLTFHAHDRAAALEEAGKPEEAEAQDAADADTRAKAEKIREDAEAANK